MAALAGVATAGLTILKDFFEINATSIDNWTFKLFYKWSTAIFVFSSVCVTHAQYFGKPILCDAGHSSSGVDEDVLNGYCWMFATYRLPPNFSGQCSSALEEEDRDVYTSYYQWVPPFLIASACLFYLPRSIWLSLEDGLMNYFSTGTRERYIENREEKRDQMISYFRKRLSNKYTNYFIGFIFCEFLNWAIVVSHFFLTDLFLNRRYLDFGFKIIEYYSLSFHKQRESWNIDPLCHVFPRVASCNYYRFGSGGFQEKINAICILGLNVINDKVFALTWFWCFVLAIFSGLRLIWRVTICCSSAFRLQVFKIRISRYLRTSEKKEQIEDFIRSRPLGDFFVLYQLGKNLNRYFFVEFVTRLSDLEEREGALGRDDKDGGDTIIDMFIKPAYDESDTLKKD